MKILAVGAHPDDIELFCGGVLIRSIREGHEVRCIVCSDGETEGKGFGNKERIEEQKRAWEFIGVKKGYLLSLPDGHLQHNLELTDKIDKIIKEYKPDVVFSHSEVDPHQDHSNVSKCVRSANRTWEFNWITYCPYDLRSAFLPNFFVGLDGDFEAKKKLLSIFKTQADRWYFREEVLISRSMGSNIGKYVEPFRIEFAFIK
jgi:LmbE family N-acetylglucosaminyl deacetylase